MTHRESSGIFANSLCDLPCRLQRCIRQDNRKLLAAEPACNVFKSHAGLQEPAPLVQYRISGVMTEGVVESFEIIQVQHEDGQRCSFPAGSVTFTFEGFFEIAPVE